MLHMIDSLIIFINYYICVIMIIKFRFFLCSKQLQIINLHFKKMLTIKNIKIELGKV